MSGSVEQAKMLGKLLKISGAMFFVAGSFLLYQGDVPLFTLIDKETDKLLGYALIAVSIADFVLAVTILNPKKTK